MFDIGPEKILLVLIVGLIVIGPTKLPEFARSVGRAFREFRNVSANVRREVEGFLEEPEPRTRSADPTDDPTTRA